MLFVSRLEILWFGVWDLRFRVMNLRFRTSEDFRLICIIVPSFTAIITYCKPDVIYPISSGPSGSMLLKFCTIKSFSGFLAKDEPSQTEVELGYCYDYFFYSHGGILNTLPAVQKKSVVSLLLICCIGISNIQFIKLFEFCCNTKY